MFFDLKINHFSFKRKIYDENFFQIMLNELCKELQKMILISSFFRKHQQKAFPMLNKFCLVRGFGGGIEWICLQGKFVTKSFCHTYQILGPQFPSQLELQCKVGMHFQLILVCIPSSLILFVKNRVSSLQGSFIHR